MKKEKRINSPKGYSCAPATGTPAVKDLKGKKLYGSFVGTVEIVVDCLRGENWMEYITDMYLAFQLVSGRIVAVDATVEELFKESPVNVMTLRGTFRDIQWGEYPIGFPPEWNGLIRDLSDYKPANFESVEIDELPF